MELLTMLGVGLVAGVFATKILKSKSYGLVIDTIIGSFGASLGSTLIALAGIALPHTFIATSVAGVVTGALVHFLANKMPVKTL